jgi:putative polyhydroxyalkanoate system protein
MAEILIQRAHTLGLEKARAIAAQWQKEAESDWGMDCTYVANESNEQGEVQDRLNFERAGASGYLLVTASQLTMKLELGFLMASFKDKIEEKISGNLDKLLS